MDKIFTVALPDIGEGVVEGEVIAWCKKVGDTLLQDEPVVIVMTDKATVELPAPHPGILAKQYKQPGEIAIKDQPLYDIALKGERVGTVSAPKKEESAKKQDTPSLLAEPAAVSDRGAALPKVRAIAKKMGKSLSEVEGSGKEGRVMAEDLIQKRSCDKAAAYAPWKFPDDEEAPLIGIKALMAKKMAASKAQIPHFSYFEQVDAMRLIQLRKNIREKAEKEGVHLTYMPLILRALSLCISKHPILNSSYDSAKGTVIFHRRQNIGVAVSTSLGLIVPVLKGVETMNLESLIRHYEELIEKAQTGKLQSSDMKEGTITVSNFGSSISNGLWATPVINPPEVAILAIGRIHPQVVARNHEIVIREVLNLSWSFDHRLIDGEAATKISHDLAVLIDNPAGLL